MLTYKLDENRNAVPCSTLEWAKQLEEMSINGTKHVAEETVGDYWISTVWLGLNNGYGKGEPLLFETMIEHNGKWMNYQVRYSTWKHAEEGHRLAVEWVRNGCIDEEE